MAGGAVPEVLDCGMDDDTFIALHNTTALNRLNIDEAIAVFDELLALGFVVAADE